MENEDEISSISRARNLSLSVPLYALKNLARDWKPIEEALPKEYRQNVLFKPNEDGEFEGKANYNVTDLIRRLALVNNNLFDFRQDKHPIKAYASPGSLVQGWKEEDYQEVIPLLEDILLWLQCNSSKSKLITKPLGMMTQGLICRFAIAEGQRVQALAFL